jgi:hypothetical protein
MLGAYQATVTEDGDPDSEFTQPGILEGLTLLADVIQPGGRFVFDEPPSGCMVYATSIRDLHVKGKFPGIKISESNDRRFTPLHESLHLFGLHDKKPGVDDGPIMDFAALLTADTPARLDALTFNFNGLLRIITTLYPGGIR